MEIAIKNGTTTAVLRDGMTRKMFKEFQRFNQTKREVGPDGEMRPSIEGTEESMEFLVTMMTLKLVTKGEDGNTIESQLSAETMEEMDQVDFSKLRDYCWGKAFPKDNDPKGQ